MTEQEWWKQLSGIFNLEPSFFEETLLIVIDWFEEHDHVLVPTICYMQEHGKWPLQNNPGPVAKQYLPENQYFTFDWSYIKDISIGWELELLDYHLPEGVYNALKHPFPTVGYYKEYVTLEEAVRALSDALVVSGELGVVVHRG